jgi:hypothetical protein
MYSKYIDNQITNDILKEILNHADIDTFISTCESNKYIKNNICTKQLWIQKFEQFDVPIFSSLDQFDDWKNLYFAYLNTINVLDIIDNLYDDYDNIEYYYKNRLLVEIKFDKSQKDLVYKLLPEEMKHNFDHKNLKSINLKIVLNEHGYNIQTIVYLNLNLFTGGLYDIPSTYPIDEQWLIYFLTQLSFLENIQLFVINTNDTIEL